MKLPPLELKARLSTSFFARPTLIVARELLGKTLVHLEDGQPIGGQIVETEAYIGEEDDACHARAGRTPRTEVLYGPPGIAYVYFAYGMHWMFNIVTETEGKPAGVLVRAIRPTLGIDRIRERRGSQPRVNWTNGPGKICQALGIKRQHHGLDICAEDATLFITKGSEIDKSAVTNSPRVGLNKVVEPWKSIPWRFLIENGR